GVVAVIYEARPNVTIDCTALALKSGNAIVLRGSSQVARSNAVLAAIATEAAVGAGVPAGAVGLVAGGGREEMAELSTQEGVVELRADARTKAAAGELADSLLDVSDEDWDTEFLAMVLAVGMVDSVESAVEHVNRHGSGHSEAIVTRSLEAAHAFERGVDAAC